MILALDKKGALYVFGSQQEAERGLEAIDVQQDAFEFCDLTGQRYAPVYTNRPKVSKIGPIGLVDIGVFHLTSDGGVDPTQINRLLERAEHIEWATIPGLATIDDVRDLIRKGGRLT